MSHVLFDAASTGSNPNANPLCGMKVRLKRGEASVDATVVDRCMYSFLFFFPLCFGAIFLAGVNGGCGTNYKLLGTGCAVKDLDVSRAVFKKLADLDLGRVSVDWAWLEEAPISVR